jgi:hypothetical protein
LQGSRCPQCLRQHHRQKRQREQQARCKTNDMPRLPDGAIFSARYDAASTSWAGTLTVAGQTFQGAAGGVVQLLRQLHEQLLAAGVVPVSAESNI